MINARSFRSRSTVHRPTRIVYHSDVIRRRIVACAHHSRLRQLLCHAAPTYDKHVCREVCGLQKFGLLSDLIP